MHFLGVYLSHLGSTWESLEPSVPSLFVRHMSGGEEPHRSWTHPYLVEAPLSPGVRIPLRGASLSDPGAGFSHNTSSLRVPLCLQADCHTYGSVPPLLHPNLSLSEPPLPPSVSQFALSLALSPALLSGAPRNPHHPILAYKKKASLIKR